MALTARKVVELIHLVFVRALFAGAQDKTLRAVKGGINLRFFFRSVRYSEDLDLDVITMSKETLKNRVDRLLRSPAVVAPLKSTGIEIAEITSPTRARRCDAWALGLR